MLALRDVDAGYGTVQILWGASLHVGAGEIVGLVGRNGVGKTTTLKAVAGLADISAGEMRFGKVSLRGVKTARLAALGIGYVAQAREICPHLSVEENLKVPLFSSGRPLARLAAIYDQFPRLKERAQQRAGSLSGGERKLLAFGRIMLLEPSLYLIDEPTGGLMPAAVAEIAALLRRLRQRGAAILLVEQNLELVRALADRIYLMKSGRVEGCVDELDDAVAQQYLSI